MNYSTPLRYFFIMSILLLLSGLWMFILHTSLSIDGVSDYYALKTFFGLLETVNPHLFGMGLFVFILTHFFAIVKGVIQESFRGFSILFFLLIILTNVSGFFIAEQSTVFALLKLISTLLFVFYSLWAMFKLYKLF
jgi:hypothetical protein